MTQTKFDGSRRRGAIQHPSRKAGLYGGCWLREHWMSPRGSLFLLKFARFVLCCKWQFQLALTSDTTSSCLGPGAALPLSLCKASSFWSWDFIPQFVLHSQHWNNYCCLRKKWLFSAAPLRLQFRMPLSEGSINLLPFVALRFPLFPILAQNAWYQDLDATHRDICIDTRDE